MTDKELQSYFQKRLADCRVSDVPSFEDMFKPEELAVVKPHVRLWPFFAKVASVAAAVLLLFMLLLPLEKPEDLLMVQAEGLSVETSLETEDEMPALDVVQEDVAARNSDAIQANPRQNADVIPFKVNNPSLSRNLSSENTLPELMASTEISETEENKAEESRYANVPETLTELSSEEAFDEETIQQYERSIEEAYAEARQSRSRKNKRRVSYGLSLSQNNGLLSSVSPANNTSGLRVSPVNNVVKQYSESGLRSATPKNEWKRPENLSASQLRGYKPVYHYPLNVGIGVNIPISRLFSVHTGLTYTYLFSETHGGQEDASLWELHQALHYVGIPLNLAVNFFDHDKWTMYASLGGGLEKALCGVQYSKVRNTINEEYSSMETTVQSVLGVQPYTSASLGLAYTFASKWQFYLAPGVNYYFDADQPLSVRTKKPLTLNVSAGFRWAL